MKKLDELFRDKLADHSIAPSAESWQKVEAKLSKKNKAIVWMRWAAVLLLGGLILGTVWLRKDDVKLPIAKETPSPQPTKEMKIQKSVRPALAEDKKVTKTSRQKKRKIESATQQIQQLPTLKEEVAQTTKEISIQLTETVQVVAKTPKAIVLTYTLDPVETTEEKSEEKAPSEVVVASDKKDTSLRRVMDFAKNVKNSESPLGGIRGMKEDLFALDLKKKTTSKKQ